MKRIAVACVALVSCTVNAPESNEPLELPQDTVLPDSVVRVDNIATCQPDEIPQRTDTGWTCAPALGTGTITSVSPDTSGTITGGAATGDVILGVDPVKVPVVDNCDATNNVPKWQSAGMWACSPDNDTGGGAGLWETCGVGNICRQTGNVGIGTATPGAHLEIAPTTDTNAPFGGLDCDFDGATCTCNPGFSFEDGNDDGSIETDECYRHALVTTAGNVGIGTMTPMRSLHVASTGAGNQPSLVLENTGNTLDKKIWNMYIASDGSLNFDEVNDLFTAGSTVFTLTKAGTVGIGTATPDPTGALLHVAGKIRVDALDAGGSTDICRHTITSNLSDCASTASYKTDIADLTSGLDTITRLRPVTFNWIEGGARDLGFIAEEVERVDRLLATYRGGELIGVKYKQMSAVLVNAVKELKAKNYMQQAQLDSYSGKLAEQQAKIDALVSLSLENRQLKGRLARLERAVETLLATSKTTKGSVETIGLR